MKTNQSQLINKTRKKLTEDLLVDVANSIINETLNQLNSFDGSNSNFYTEALNYINNDYNAFKNYVYLALKKVFTHRELEFLDKSNEDSRNYLIAYKKLHKFYKSNLSKEDKESFHLTFNEMLAMVFEFMSAEYVDMTDPNARWAETKAEKSRLKDYNSISEMFIK